MNPINPTATSRPPGFKKRYIVALAAFLLLLFAGAWVVSVFSLSADTRVLRDSALATIEGQCDHKITLRAGGFIVGLVRVASGIFQPGPEPRALLQSLQSAELSVYQIDKESAPLNRAGILVRADDVLTQDKCYRGGELDEEFGYTLTQVRGYPSNEHESAQQTGVFN
jgi:hypothetical protein